MTEKYMILSKEVGHLAVVTAEDENDAKYIFLRDHPAHPYFPPNDLVALRECIFFPPKNISCSLDEGLKFDDKKPRMDLLDPYSLEILALVLGFGAKKYGVDNWRKGIKISRLVAAALRHIFAFMRGENLDDETQLSHIGHAMCCCMFIIWMVQHKRDMDDRKQGVINI